MNYEDRGPGLFGLIRWECYCLRLDPDVFTMDEAKKLLAENGYSSKDIDRVKDGDNRIAVKVAKIAWDAANASRFEKPKIHWNAKMPIVPRVSREAD